jgi:RNA polymerase sigma-70 factor (ECF subfamily)
MSNEPSPKPSARLLAQHARLVAQLHARGECARWGLSENSFAEALSRSLAKRFHDKRPGPAEVESYLNSLHLEDLALACACAEGIDEAWEFFVAHFRADLRQAAGSMLRSSGRSDEARAAELADSVYAELYGLRSSADGRRKPLFEYFHGRSKLSTWLRAVLAQRHVDMIRAGGKTVSLDDASGSEAPREFPGRAEAVRADPDRERYLRRFDRALRAALENLQPRERMVLACYYVDQASLAEIGEMLGEHESTISRHLERTRRALRERVTEALQREIPAYNGSAAEPALDRAQIELAFEYALEDWPFDLSQALSTPEPAADPPEK